MKDSQKGFIVPLVILVVAVLAVGGAIYWFSDKPPFQGKNNISLTASTTILDETGLSTQSQTSIDANRNLFVNEKNGFSFEYPRTWKITKSNDCYPAGNCITELTTDTHLTYQSLPDTIRITISNTASTTSASAYQAQVLAIINGHYKTPEFGVDTDYSQEGSRYKISDFTNVNKVHLYQTNFTGKYSIVSRSYIFDTKNSYTVQVSLESLNFSDKAFYINFPNFKKLIDSIKVL